MRFEYQPLGIIQALTLSVLDICQYASCAFSGQKKKQWEKRKRTFKEIKDMAAKELLKVPQLGGHWWLL